MKFFENIYNFIAKKWDKLFVIIGFASYAAMIIFSFIGGVSTNGDGSFGYIVTFIFDAALLLGIVGGYFLKNKNLLFVSFVVYLALTLYTGIVYQTAAVQSVYVDNGADVANWVFGFIFDLVVAAYIVLLILTYLFNIKGLEKIAHILYLAIFPLGLLAWIMGIVFAANNGGWYNAIVPLFEAASFLFVPAILIRCEENPILSSQSSLKEEPVVNEVPNEEEKIEETSEEIEEPEVKDEEPTKEVVEPEVEEEPKE